MQPVWRGERQQKGRYKEFVQADIDTIWDSRSTSDYLGYDAETVVVLAYTFTQILQKLDIKTGLTVKINNRKLITGMLE
jgi:histidyl-tRNA synthetase